MKSVSTLALGISLALGGMTFAAPAAAQGQAAPVAEPRKYKLSKAAQKPIVALQAAAAAGDPAAYAAALAAAEASAENTDDRYVIGQIRLGQAIKANDDAQKATAIDALIRSGGATAAEMPKLYRNLGSLSYNAKQYDQAATAFEKAIELQPNDTEAMTIIAEIRAEQNNPQAAIASLERAIAASKAAGTAVPDTWYKRGLRFAYEGQLGPQIASFSRNLISDYPTPTNWRDALVIYRDGGKLDKATNLDLMRLMRAAKALSGERDFYEYADTLDSSGLPGETKAVLDEAIAARAIDGNKSTFKDLLAVANGRVADDKAALAGLETKALAASTGTAALSTAEAYYGYGNYTKAAELYRAALQKGSVDANVANTRLGIALAMAGQKAEAEAAFKAVTGPRADLAGLWMLWLSQRS